MAAEEAGQPDTSTPSAESLQYVINAELLSLTVQRPDHAVFMVYVAGEVDMLTGPILEEQLNKLLITRPELLIIDLSQVTFLGSTGLYLLIEAKQVAALQGTTLQLTGIVQRAVARPLEITGLIHLFETLPAATE